jgi:hypothetical protein
MAGDDVLLCSQEAKELGALLLFATYSMDVLFPALFCDKGGPGGPKPSRHSQATISCQ